jgi:type IV secretory pathway TraG/TraD family ATPase VirD4
MGDVLSRAPLPNALFIALAMPVMAFVIGSLTPVVLAPKGQDRSIIRGTRILPHKANSFRMIFRTTARRAVTLAGLQLERPAEVRHIGVIGVTGSGKSTAVRALMATATRRGDRHVVADPDGSAMSLFHQDSDVILNPFDARSAKWDSLAEIREDTDYRFLTESVLPFSKGGDDSEWVKDAREIFVACLRSWHLNGIGSSDAFFAAMATADKDKLAAPCEGSGAHRYFETRKERTLSLPDSDSRRIRFHVDELDALGRIQNLEDAQSQVRKKGGCVVLGFQSITQVRAVYGDAEAHTVVENCDNKLILRCGASENGGTAAFASTLIGDQEIRRDDTSTSLTSGGWSGSTSSTSSIRRQVETAVLPSEIMRLPDPHGYL